jgi:hypothetical protein
MKIPSVILGYNPTSLSILFIYVAKFLLETNSSLSLSPHHLTPFSFFIASLSLSPPPISLLLRHPVPFSLSIFKVSPFLY